MKIKAFVLVTVMAATCLVSGQSQDKSDVLQRAQAGDPAAQVQMGNKYALGLGVPRDPDKAMDWFKRAADQGYADGQYRLGGMYDVGHISKQDPVTAIIWYTRAAKQGHRDA